MRREDILSRLRWYLFDAGGAAWSDVELSAMLDRAAEAYSFDTGYFRSRFDLVVSEDGKGEFPDSYLSFLAAWNNEGQPIRPVSPNELANYASNYAEMTGVAEFITGDLTSNGAFRLVPNPAGLSSAVEYEVEPYGVLLDGWGVLDDIGYGVCNTLTDFLPVGEVHFVRKGEVEEIKDHTALIFHVLGQAFNADTDFNNPDRASAYFAKYRERISGFVQIRKKAYGKLRGGKFF